MKKDGVLYTILFSFVTTFVFVFLLSLSNEGTKDIVARNRDVNEARAIFVALDIDVSAKTAQQIIETYRQMAQIGADVDGMPIDIRSTDVDGKAVFAQRIVGAGLWGEIELVVGFNADLTRFTGLEVVRHNETPGLGGRIDEDWYKNQFRGQRIPDDGVLRMLAGSGRGDAEKDNDAVDAVTGATRTSESMMSIIANAVLRMRAALN